MAAGEPWSIDEITLALALYFRTPYSRISTRNPDIQALAAQLNRTPGSVSLKLGNLANLDLRVLQSGRKGFANGGKNDRIVWDQYVGKDGDIALQRLTERVDLICQGNNDLRAESILISSNHIEQHGPTTREVTRLERCYQSMFRSVVLSRYEGRCAVSGLHLDSLLEAAHIVPWAEDETIRLEPNNGLALNPLIHKAYDQNLLGIDGGGIIHVSKELLDNAGNQPMHAFLEDINQTRIFMPHIGRPSEELLDRHYQNYLQAHS